jgi:hypothetical protein
VTWSCELRDLEKFVHTATPNEKFLYYTGFNISDTIIGRELAKITYDFAVKGKIYLVQRRADYYNFDYIIIKASTIPIRTLIPFTDAKRKEKRYG